MVADLLRQEVGVLGSQLEGRGGQEVVRRWRQTGVPVVLGALDELLALGPDRSTSATVEAVERGVVAIRRARVGEDSQAAQARPIDDARRSLNIGARIDADDSGRRTLAARLEAIHELCLEPACVGPGARRRDAVALKRLVEPRDE